MPGRTRVASLIIAALVAAAALYVATSIGAHPEDFDPSFQITAISDTTPGANADITFRTAVPAGDQILGNWSLEVPVGWSVAGHSNQLNGEVTAVGTMTVGVVMAPPPQDCSTASTATYPFNLVDINPGSGQSAPDARWVATKENGNPITQFGDADPDTYWDLQIDLTDDVFSAIMTNAFGVTICMEQIFTITMCGRSNPSAAATVCGSNRVVMTNPGAAGPYTWFAELIDDSSLHSPRLPACVAIGGASCPTPTVTTPTPTSTPTPMPTPSSTPTATATATPMATATATATPTATATATATPTATPTATATPATTATATGTPPPMTQGNVNCDGLVNVVDALFVLQFEVGLRVDSGGCPLAPPPPDTLNVAACNVNGDGLCNVVDALFILQCEVGIPNTFCPVR